MSVVLFGIACIIAVVEGVIITDIPTSAPTAASTDITTFLSELYVATQGAFWTNNDNWLDYNVSYSTWYGVSESDGSLSISLANNNLKGMFLAFFHNSGIHKFRNVDTRDNSGQRRISN